MNYIEKCLAFREKLIAFWSKKKTKHHAMHEWKLKYVLEKIREQNQSVVLEIGTRFGITAATLAYAIKECNREPKIVSYDIQNYGQNEIFVVCPELRPFVSLYVFPKEQIHKVLSIINSVDILLVDGAHDMESVKWDYETFSGIVKKGGYIYFDDSAIDPETTKYLARIFASLLSYQEQQDTFAYKVM